MSDSDKDTRTMLKETLDVAEWSWLEPHMERESLVIVSQDLDILDVGVKIVEDDVNQVQEWITQELISKPTPAQCKAWEANSSKKFTTLIVQPYVLAQELAH